MSRLLILLIFALWLLNPPGMTPPAFGLGPGLALFFGGYALLIAVLALWARGLGREIQTGQVLAGQRRFNRMVSIARAMVPIWLAAGLYGYLGWGHLIVQTIGRSTALNIPHSPATEPVELALPALIVGIAPAILAWIGLWWAQFPADRALREQSLLDQIELDLPAHAPPTLWQYLSANFRQQILFMGLPILMILLVRDVALLAFRVAHVGIGRIYDFENLIILPSAALVFILAPEILRRVLKTQRLPDGHLRQRLESICRNAGLRYREILLWDTQYSMGNAAVMGILPGMRYILMSDLLLESLTDEQIEAVFAHEIGHIRHHHMIWYVAFFALIALAAIGPGVYIENAIDKWGRIGHSLINGKAQAIWELVSALGILGLTLALFGYISRRFECQADVFAARMMESNWGEGRAGQSPAAPLGDAASSHVGPQGASIFAEALRRVAVINNIPTTAPSWCHGSIARRMAYLHTLSADPTRTTAFDRFMSRLYATLILAILMCGAIAFVAR